MYAQNFVFRLIFGIFAFLVLRFVAIASSPVEHRLESEAQDLPLHLTHPSEHPVEQHLGFVPTGKYQSTTSNI
jgi:hypothetical protein